MDLTGVNFLLFLGAGTLLYYVATSKSKGAGLQNMILLLLSCAFYLGFGWKPALMVAGTGLVTWAAGLAIERSGQKSPRAAYILTWFISLALLGIWYIFKSLGFLALRSDLFANLADKIVIPVGISFFMLQAVSYLVDIRRGKLTAEKNLLYVLIYMFFFPVVTSGPIQRGSIFMPMLRKRRELDWDNIEKGLLMMLWGFFQKLVLSNRLAPFGASMNTEHAGMAGSVLLMSLIFFIVQLYFDFAGYSDIAIGAAMVLGFHLPPNFRYPFRATRLRDLWRGWHMSLTGWLTQYVYITFGGSRHGAIRRYINTLLVFIGSAIWHGTGSHYLVWGIGNALVLILSEMTEPLRVRLAEKTGLSYKKLPVRIVQRAIVFATFVFLVLFFQADSVGQAFDIMREIRDFQPGALLDGSLLEYGLTLLDWIIVFAAILVFWAGDSQRYQGKLYERLKAMPTAKGVLLTTGLVFVIVLFGHYGSGYQAVPFNYTLF